MGITILTGKHKVLNKYMAVCPQLFIAVEGASEEDARNKCIAVIKQATGIDLNNPAQATKVVDRDIEEKQPDLADLPVSDDLN